MTEGLPSKRKQTILLVFALLCGILYDYLFYGKPAGLSYPLFVGLLYGIFVWACREKLEFEINFGWMLIIPIMMLSLTYVLFTNPIFKVLNGAAIPMLIAIHCYLTAKGKEEWGSRKVIAAVLKHVIPQSIGNLKIPARLIVEPFKNKIAAGKSKPLLHVIIGLVISIPILILVTTLLASADTVFENAISAVPSLFSDIPVGEIFFRVLWIVIAAFYLFSFIWGLLTETAREEEEFEQSAIDEISPISFDSVIAITVLTAVNIVYILFTAIQFSYFFGGGNDMLPTGTTYAEYARKGFAELVVVTIINFSILLVAMNFISSRSKSMVDIVMKWLQSLLIGCTAVMLLSAYIRLSLYEQAYGYTYIRILVHAFMIFLLVLLVLALFKIWRQSIPLLKCYIIVSLFAYVVLNYMNIDAIISEKNIERYRDTGKIDLYYLTNLSYDAVPYLVGLSEDLGNPDELESNLLSRKAKLEEEASWSSFNLAKYRALKELQQ